MYIGRMVRISSDIRSKKVYDIYKILDQVCDGEDPMETSGLK